MRALTPFVFALLVACGGGEPVATAVTQPSPVAEGAPAAEGQPGPAVAGSAADNAGADQRSEDAAVGSSPAARGKALFNQPLLGAQAGCVSCHKVATDAKLVGPSLKGIVERAKTRIEGKDAETYISESILKPNEHIVEGFVEGLMPTGYEAELVEDGNDEQLRDLVAYLMTL